MRPASPSAPAPAPPLEDDNILEQILIRLPPRPSSLPRAAAVCKRWRLLVSDPQFRRRFRAHHREPPLLGVFIQTIGQGPVFLSILDPPDAIPPERFSFGDSCVLCCRHGRVLIYDNKRNFIVWDPVTGDRRCVPAPPEVDDEMEVYGAVLCTADDQGHVHGVDCHTSPFQVILICYSDESEWYRCVYSSDIGEWGDFSSAAIPDMGYLTTASVLSGDSLYWLPDDVQCGILKFDLGSQNLALIELPPDLECNDIDDFCVLRTFDGGVGLAVLTDFILDMWERKLSCNGAARWVLQKTVNLKEVTGLSWMEGDGAMIHGYDEDGAVIFIMKSFTTHDTLRTSYVFFMVQLGSMQFRNLGCNFFIGDVSMPYRNFLC